MLQVLLYADACERAGTFNPCGVAEALEGFEFDGWATARRCIAPKTTSASRTFWSCAVRRTRPTAFDTLEIVEVTPVEQVTYAPNHPMFGGDEANLGTCNPGA